MSNRIALFILFVLMPLSACTTTQYRQVSAQCTGTWSNKIPPRYEQRVVNTTRMERRPSGIITCNTSGTQTICHQGTRLVSVPTVSVRTVDINQGVRNSRINTCAANRCVKKFGNPECKEPK
jgi:hypothetical protein